MKELNKASDCSLESSLQSENISKHLAASRSREFKEKRVYTKRTCEKIKRWTTEECKAYEDFILQNNTVMNDSSTKRTEKIFLSMALFIGSKSASQCRSHHQKFFKRVLKELQMSKEESLNSTGTGEVSFIPNESQRRQEQGNKDERAASLDHSLLQPQGNQFFSEEEIHYGGFRSDYDSHPHLSWEPPNHASFHFSPKDHLLEADGDGDLLF